MDSVRQNKVSRLLQKELSQIFQLKIRDYLPGGIITVTVVRVAPDLSIAKAYLSVFPTKEQDTVVDRINETKSVIRKELGMRIKKQIRVIPDLAFFLDDSCDYAEKIDNLLKSNK